jgi:hypothetical protein
MALFGTALEAYPLDDCRQVQARDRYDLARSSSTRRAVTGFDAA